MRAEGRSPRVRLRRTRKVHLAVGGFVLLVAGSLLFAIPALRAPHRLSGGAAVPSRNPTAVTTGAATTPGGATTPVAGTTSSGPQRMLVFGHSFAAGVGATSPLKSWARLTASNQCRTLTNEAKSGALSAATAKAVSHFAVKPTDVAVIETGVNDVRVDIRRSLTPADELQEYAQALTTILDHLRSIPVVLLAEPGVAAAGWSAQAPFDSGTNARLAALDDKLVEVAANFPNASVVDVRSSWSRADIAADLIHPNDAGHAIIAKAVEAELTRRSLRRC